MASTNTSPIDDKSVILWKDETLGVVKVNETPAGSGWSVIAWEVGPGIRKVNQRGNLQDLKLSESESGRSGIQNEIKMDFINEYIWKMYRKSRNCLIFLG